MFTILVMQMAPRKSTKYYWIDRVAERNARNLKLTKEQCRKLLRELYQEQSEELKAALTDTFLKIVSDKASDDKIMMNDLYLTNKYHLLLEEFNKRAKELGGKQVEITEKALLDVYQLAQETIEKELPKGLVKPSFVVPAAIDAKEAIHQTWCLDGMEFSDRIWKNKRLLVKDLEKTMADFIARGESPYKIAEGIVKRLDVDEYCAFRIARTEAAHAQVKGSIDKYTSLGFTHGIFRSVDPCDECGELDGKEFTLKELETMIPKHPNCECSFDLKV